MPSVGNMITEDKYDSWKDTFEHVKNVQAKLLMVIAHLMDRAWKHDASKFESPEKEYYDKFSPKLRTTEYGSQEYKDYLVKMQPGIDHHYQNNSHHPEFYVDGVDGMNLIDLMEMLCDWKAAGERHKTKPTNIIKSIEINAERFHMSEQLKQILLNTASHLEWI